MPLYSVQIRKAYGLGPYAMSGWGSARRVPELRLAWPSVESGGMSLEGVDLNTVVLWIGPFVLGLAGIVYLVFTVRRRS